MAKARANAAEWARRVAAWRSSGESATKFAARDGWNPKTLSWWSTRLLRREEGARAAPPMASFVQVVERPERQPSALELVVPRVGTVRISTSTDLVLLRAVIDALGGRE